MYFSLPLILFSSIFLNVNTSHLFLIVSIILSPSVVHIMNTTCLGGSSKIFNNVCAAGESLRLKIFCTSSKITMILSFPIGFCFTDCSNALISSTLLCSATS